MVMVALARGSMVSVPSEVTRDHKASPPPSSSIDRWCRHRDRAREGKGRGEEGRDRDDMTDGLPVHTKSVNEGGERDAESDNREALEVIGIKKYKYI